MSDLARRDFLRLAGAAGAGLLTGGLKPRAARAATPSLPLLVVANAFGGADVSLFCDPKSGPLYPLNNFTANDYTQVGPFTLGPASLAAVQYFQRYQSKILLINGIYPGTISHAAGQSLAMSGSSLPNFPSLTALMAAHYGRDLGLSFVSSGGYDQTHHEVGKTLSTPSLLTALSGVSGASPVYSAADLTAINGRIQARLQKQLAAATMPSVRDSLLQVQAARQGWAAYPDVVATIADLQAHVPLVDGVVGNPGAHVTAATNPLFLATQVTLAGYLHGATLSGNLAMGNLDQHTGFGLHPLLIDSFFVGLDYLWRCAAYLGVADKVILMTGSDFTRSPHAIGPADDQGKDHWIGTTSSLFMGPGISGNRLIGASTDGSGSSDADASYAKALDPKTLQPAASGITLERSHIHAEMRRILGLSGKPLDQAYPLSPTGGQITLLG